MDNKSALPEVAVVSRSYLGRHRGRSASARSAHGPTPNLSRPDRRVSRVLLVTAGLGSLSLAAAVLLEPLAGAAGLPTRAPAAASSSAPDSGRIEAALVLSERAKQAAAAARSSVRVAPAGNPVVIAAPVVSRAAQARLQAAAQLASADPKTIARAMVADRGWGEGEFSCLEKLWTKESQWQATARNPSSGAYGIPQSLPANKMASAGSDWQTNPATQITWGLGYIKNVYGSPCRAWNHSQRTNWY